MTINNDDNNTLYLSLNGFSGAQWLYLLRRLQIKLNHADKSNSNDSTALYVQNEGVSRHETLQLF